MKLIIAGTRNRELSIFDMEEMLCEVINTDDVTEHIYGCAAGIDECGKKWARSKYIESKPFPADWANIDAPGAVVRENRYGKYNANAGKDRNQAMADYCEPGDVLAAFRWNNSPGTSDMIRRATQRGLTVYVFDFDNEGKYIVTNKT